jgi:hypothetical protein
MASSQAIARKHPESGTLYLRDGVTLAFFLPPPLEATAPQVLAAFEEYLNRLPSGALRWAAVGASAGEWKPFARSTVGRCRALLAPEAARKRYLTAFELSDGDQGGDAPGYGVAVVGQPVTPDAPNATNLVQFFFPAAVTAPGRVEEFVATASALAALLPYRSGYGSPALQVSELHQAQALAEARALAVRYPGYDVQYNQLGRLEMDAKVRGARWLTFLGPDLVSALGGEEALRHALPAAVSVRPVGHGLLLRAGEYPEICDANRQAGTPLLRAVAAVLEPVTRFGEEVLLATNFAADDEDFLRRWERRFLD